MSGNHLPYKLFKRSFDSGKTIYYVRYHLGGGKYTAGRSTGQTSKKKAILEVEKTKSTGIIVTKKRIRLKTIATNFFDWNGEWATDKKAASRKTLKTRISEDQCKSNQARTDLHIIKTIGHVYLEEIDDLFIREFRRKLIDKNYAASTINKIMYCLKAILRYCVKRRLITALPDFPIPLETVEKEPEIFTQDELTALFNLSWPDLRIYTACLISSATGFRLSEVMGIKRRNINGDSITITGSWSSRSRKYKHELKNKKSSRTVPIPPAVSNAITTLLNESPFKGPESFLLYCPGYPEKPIEHIEIPRGLYDMLTKLDPPIKEEERKRRHLSFHCFRYGFNTALIESGMPLEKIKKLTGHLSDSMVQRYYRLQDLSDVQEVTGSMLENVIPFRKAQ